MKVITIREGKITSIEFSENSKDSYTMSVYGAKGESISAIPLRKKDVEKMLTMIKECEKELV